MSKKANATANTTATVNDSFTFSESTFLSDKLLAKYAKEEKASDGTAIVSYEMKLSGKNDVQDYILTDQKAILAIEGIRQADKLEKYASYRKGAYLVDLVNSPFMKDNQIESVGALAKSYELGVETSTANALENVCRKLGVKFDDNNVMTFADSDLPQLSFWHYSQVISLVTANDDGTYNYANLKEFFRLANVSPLMSQKRLKELFNDYRNGRLEGQKLELPDSITEKAKKDAERVAKAEKEKQIAEDAKKNVSAKVALEKAQSFGDKQSVAISAVQALHDCLEAINVEYDFSDIMTAIVSAEPPTATPKQDNE